MRARAARRASARRRSRRSPTSGRWPGRCSTAPSRIPRRASAGSVRGARDARRGAGGAGWAASFDEAAVEEALRGAGRAPRGQAARGLPAAARGDLRARPSRPGSSRAWRCSGARRRCARIDAALSPRTDARLQARSSFAARLPIARAADSGITGLDGRRTQGRAYTNAGNGCGEEARGNEEDHVESQDASPAVKRAPPSGRRRPRRVRHRASGERHQNEGHGRRLTMAFEALEAFPALAESRNRLLAVISKDHVATADVVDGGRVRRRADHRRAAPRQPGPGRPRARRHRRRRRRAAHARRPSTRWPTAFAPSTSSSARACGTPLLSAFACTHSPPSMRPTASPPRSATSTATA